MNELRVIKTDRGISYNQEVLVKRISSIVSERRLSNITVICPKLARRLPKDEHFWKEVDGLVNGNEPIIMIWPTNFNYTCYRADEVKECLDKIIADSETRPWINKL